MFFTPKQRTSLGTAALRFTSDTQLVLPQDAPEDLIRGGIARMAKASAGTAIERLSLHLGVPAEIQGKIENYAENQEEYVISLGQESHIWAHSIRGFLYAMATLEQLNAGGELAPLFLYDYPVSPIRGYRVFLPGAEAIDDFKRMIDMLVYYKYNTVILEIGGAMEYKKHPEVNAAWIAFCQDVRRYSGRAHEIQFKTYPWEKDSIHCDNADGGVLTQAQCADIAAYCRERGIEVIPEEPTLSHTDYMCLAHPEIREREGDAYPDTYCPSNPASYQLAFELLEEVIQVFHPSYINIGHDEVYSIGVCPRCRDKSPVELYVADVTKLHDFLAARGIKTMMWGEKLLDARDQKGRTIGGAETRKVDPETGEEYVHIPALHGCADKLPRDIRMLHWYWEFGEEYDRVFHKNGYEMVFGNLGAASFERWRERFRWGAKGAFVSNWGSNAEEYLQRNNQTFQLILTAYALWCPEYDDDIREETGMRAAAEYFRRRHEGMQRTVTVIHNTDLYIRHKFFYDGIFITEEKFKLGDYQVTYSDGTKALLPVFYGTHILGKDTARTVRDVNLTQSFGSTMPKIIDGVLYNECAYEDPCPEKTPVGLAFLPYPGKEGVKVNIHSVTFG